MHSFTSTSPEEAEKGVLSSLSAISTPSKLRTIHRRIVRVILPSFVSRSEKHVQDKTRATDFLDGMRGYAAFAVYLCHFIMPTHPKAHMGFGGNDGVDDYWLPQLPIVRLLYSGHMCACLFFVISGFSISLKPLQLARKGSYAQLFDTMVSATFRRPCSLYLPCFAMLAITFFLSCCGAFDFSYALTKDWPFPSKPLRIPAVHDSTSLQLKDFTSQLWEWADPLNRKTKHIPYGVQLWTIPVKLRCSFISFLTIIGLAKVRPTVRMSVTAAIAAYFQFRKHPEATLFLAGTILAEIHLMHEERAAPGSSRNSESRAQKLRAGLLFVFGLFLASYPPHGADKALFWSPFHQIASFIVGENEDTLLYLFTTVASTLLVYVASQSSFLKGLFTTPLARYLGKISFALYCVHQALINWFGYRSILFFWTMTGRETIWCYEVGIGLAWVFQTIVTIWAADIFWRLINAPCVGFTKWVERACFVSS